MPDNGDTSVGYWVMNTKSVNDGFFLHPGVAYLQTLYDDPGFAVIRAVHPKELRLRRQKK